MKFKTSQPDLKKLFESLAVSCDLEGKGLKPLFQHIKIEAHKERILFYAHTMTGSLVKTLKAESEFPGACTVPAKETFNLIKVLNKEKPIFLEQQEDGRLMIKQGRSKKYINTIDPRQFPKMVYFKPEEYLPLDPAALLDALKSTFYCVADGDAWRGAINGVLLDPIENGFVRVVATNGIMLSCIKIPGVLNSKVVLPPSAVSTLLKILPDSEEFATLLNDNQLCTCLDDGAYNTNVIDQAYPDYTKVFPTSAFVDFVFNRKEYIETVKRALLFSEEGRITYLLKKEMIQIKSKGSKAESFEELPVVSLDCPPDFTELELSLNGEKLLQLLSHLKEENCTMRIHGALSPIVFPEKELTKVLMPLK